MKIAASTLLAAVLLCLAGCGDTLWWEYRDDPYIANLAQKGEGEVMRAVNAVRPEQRMMALRILAHQAGEARRKGRVREAERLDETILARHAVEKDQAVRACIVRISAPAAGRSPRMVFFLRSCIAAGEFPGYAALSLATLAPRSAFDDIEPLTRHPAPEVRLQAAEALIVLGDPKGYAPVAAVWREMQRGEWPEYTDGVHIRTARRSLEERAERIFGRGLGERK